MEQAATDIKDILKGLGIKTTIPRVVIYQALTRFTHHPSAEDVYKSIHKKYPSISLATVYKTLDMLVQNKLALKVVTDEDKVRYDHRMDSHIHLYCEKTGKIMDYEDAELYGLIQAYIESKNIDGFQVSRFQINLNGESIPLKKINKI